MLSCRVYSVEVPAYVSQVCVAGLLFSFISVLQTRTFTGLTLGQAHVFVRAKAYFRGLYKMFSITPFHKNACVCVTGLRFLHHD